MAGPARSRRRPSVGGRHAAVRCSTLRSRSTEMKAEVLGALEEHLWPALAAGDIRIKIHAVLPITEAEAAHAILQRRENLGKVVLRVG